MGQQLARVLLLVLLARALQQVEVWVQSQQVAGQEAPQDADVDLKNVDPHMLPDAQLQAWRHLRWSSGAEVSECFSVAHARSCKWPQHSRSSDAVCWIGCSDLEAGDGQWPLLQGCNGWQAELQRLPSSSEVGAAVHA